MSVYIQPDMHTHTQKVVNFSLYSTYIQCIRMDLLGATALSYDESSRVQYNAQLWVQLLN